jgi:hypothetical protein
MFVVAINDNKCMQKEGTNPNNESAKIAARVKRTAGITGFSVRTVQRVIQGQQKNDRVLSVYMQITELDEQADDILKKTSLVKAAEKLVPLN